MTAFKFNVVFEDAGDGWVRAHVHELPEIHTQGEGLEQARPMVREAIELTLEDRRERGEEIPATGWARVEAVEIAVTNDLSERDAMALAVEAQHQTRPATR